MLVIACVLLYLAIVKQYEPLLLLPIAFGMVLTNLPGAGMYHSELFAGGHVHWQGFDSLAGLVDYLYLGVKLGIYPCLIFVGVGAMTDFGPLIANPKSLLLGAAAQLGIFATYLGAMALGLRLPRLPRRVSSVVLTAPRPSTSPRSWRPTFWAPLPLPHTLTWHSCR